ncbi:MAG TPA: PPC domain-containing DNA-binding protein [Chloroflexia bacterium]|nr:PPC domain-containing DNA-binding protein [Chloroflexia bacterium]
MKTKLLNSQPGAKTYAVVFDKNDEVIKGLTDFATQQNLEGSQITAIGAFSDMVLGYFDRERKDYKKIPINEQVEVLSLIGDIAIVEKTGKHQVHAHVVVGKSDGTAHGGHILEAHVWPTLEVIITENPRHLQRKSDPETGLALISL